MKNNLRKTLLILPLVMLIACCGAGTAFASPHRWFGSFGMEDNNAFVDSWIRATVSPETEFGSDEEYTAEFTVTQWAESGNYKLIISKVGFLHAAETAALGPDEMWEYSADGTWAPVSRAEGMELIPVVTVNTNTAYLKLRLKPGFFQTPDFTEYLEYSLELTAVLTALV